MKLPTVQRFLVLLCVLQTQIGSSNGCLSDGADYNFYLRLPNKLVVAEQGIARVPCAFTAPMRAHSGRQVWFRDSPEFPLSPPQVERKDGLLRPMISTHLECSVILRDVQDSSEYGFMLEWGEGERYVFPDRVKVTNCVVNVNITSSTEVFVAGEKSLLTCSLLTHCPGGDPKVTWKGLEKGSKQVITFTNGDRRNDYLRHSEQLVYTPVPEDHQAEVTCEATLGENLSGSSTVTLTVHSQPQILNSSECTLQNNTLNCVCVSQAVPLPDIHWPLAEDKDEFFRSMASDHRITVASTFRMQVENFTSDDTVTCVSRNALGIANVTLPVNVIEG